MLECKSTTDKGRREVTMKEKKHVVQTLLEKIAEKGTDTASWFFLYEPEIPECLREKDEEQ